MKWTNEQHDAIFADGGRILVSAAAGSGKTAVLVERVIRRLVDEKSQTPANRIMVATFSNAAAKEMLERIESKLSTLIMENPDNLRLQRQRILLNQASISTVHSFCLKLIRENFHQLDISSDFRIGDESEIQMIKSQSIDEVLEEYYKQGDQDFLDLVELLNDGRDDRKLPEIILQIEKFTSAHPYPLEFLEKNLEEYDPSLSILETTWGKEMFLEGREALQYLAEVCGSAIEVIKEDEKMEAAYLESFDFVKKFVKKASTILEKRNWDEVVQYLNSFEFPRLKALVGYNESSKKALVVSIQKEIKSTMSNLSGNMFFLSENDHKKDMEELFLKVKMLFSLVEDFLNRFFANKQKNNLLDFSDLEHLCLILLLKEDDKGGYKKTKIAEEISKKYDYILVDEYQDTNEVQDLIFKTVSKNEENLFMVGDVKQSIYSFRQAMPEIFLTKRSESRTYNESEKKFPAKISLNKNFRSSEEICLGINTVFNDIMSENVGGVDYRDEALIAGADYDIHREDNGSDKGGMEIVAVSAKDDKRTVYEQEAQVVASKVAELIDNNYQVYDKEIDGVRPCRYEDFCILLRSRTHITSYEKALENLQIPSWSDFSSTFFNTKEVMQMVSILQVIDNPLLDIEIVSVMMSPMFGFSLDELSKIRLVQQGPIYLTLLNEKFSGDEKIKNFLKIIDELRRYSVSNTVDKLIEKIFQLTYYDLYVRSMKNGAQRILNLHLLISQANNYENAGYRGLSGFNRHILRMIEGNLDVKRDLSLPVGDNLVKIMTMHRSKGLEFPICFVVATSQKFNLMDTYKPTLLHSRLGFGCKNKNLKNLKRFSTLPYETIKTAIKKDSLSEEIRVLYVAMTRAKEKLVIFTSERNLEKKVGSLSVLSDENQEIKPFTILSQNSFSDWILLSALRYKESNTLREKFGLGKIKEEQGSSEDDKRKFSLEYFETTSESEIIEVFKSPPQEVDLSLYDELSSRLDFKYNYLRQTKTPSKIGVSQMETGKKDKERIYLKRPKVMYIEGLTPAEKGNAHHTFMQFADYEKARENPEDEIKSLLEKKYLSKEEAGAIDPKKIKKFFLSDLFKRIHSSKDVKRELGFIVALDNDNKVLSSDEDATMVQGIVDCVFSEDDKLVIVDYKTDRVKNEGELISRYKNQLDIYALALNKSYNKKVKEKIIYSFHLNKEIIV